MFEALVLWSTLLVTRGAAPAPAVHLVDVTASRGHFEPSTIEVIEGEPVRLVVRSRDVAHGFAVPKLNIERHVPGGGEPIAVEFVAPPPGRFEISCSEFCGRGHEAMHAVIISRPAPTGR